jgi:hypothetical protein
MIDAGTLVVSGATESLLERTGRVSVDVGPDAHRLLTALEGAGLAGVLVDGLVEVEVADDAQLDAVRDMVADLELPLYRMTSRLTSLDEVFLRRASRAS